MTADGGGGEGRAFCVRFGVFFIFMKAISFL